MKRELVVFGHESDLLPCSYEAHADAIKLAVVFRGRATSASTPRFDAAVAALLQARIDVFQVERDYEKGDGAAADSALVDKMQGDACAATTAAMGLGAYDRVFLLGEELCVPALIFAAKDIPAKARVVELATSATALDAFVRNGDCSSCATYFDGYESGGDVFPSGDWEVIEAEEHPVGTHGGGVGMTGFGRCRTCGQQADFSCYYGPGYRFVRR